MDRVYLFDEAWDVVKSLVPSPAIEEVELDFAQGRVLAADVKARINVPPFARAMMDGFAVQSGDVAQENARLTVIGSAAAGEWCRLKVEPGQAVRIMTGAAVPEGADTVVRFEWCQEVSPKEVVVLKSVRYSESVQPEGEDGRKGSVILRRGTVLKATDIALGRTFGVSSATVFKRPAATIVVTGSELVQDVHQPLAPGQIYGTNDSFLKGALVEDGIEVTGVYYVRDDPAEIEQAIVQSMEKANFILLTGGASAGDFDFVPNVLSKLSGGLAVKKVLMRPGSPFAAAKIGDHIAFAMSGNPAAGFVQFETLVRPVIRRACSWNHTPFQASGKLAHDLELKPIKHVRIFRAKAVVVDGEVLVDARVSQSSGVMSSFAETNCLIRLDSSSVAKGTVVALRWFNTF